MSLYTLVVSPSNHEPDLPLILRPFESLRVAVYRTVLLGRLVRLYLCQIHDSLHDGPRVRTCDDRIVCVPGLNERSGEASSSDSSTQGAECRVNGDRSMTRLQDCWASPWRGIVSRATRLK